MGTLNGDPEQIYWVQRRRHLDESQQCILNPSTSNRTVHGRLYGTITKLRKCDYWCH
ncbi:unnamed protein product, partial [Nesidiocoris tenuis]